MKGFKLITIFLGVMLWVLGFHAVAFAKTSSTKIHKINAGQNMRGVKQNHAGTFYGNGKRTTTVQGSTSTKPSQTVQPKSVYKSPASPSIKNVDRFKSAPPYTSRSSLYSSSSKSSGGKPSSSRSKK
ncbi:MAG: hypothetical protein WB930_12515 [Syntrophobacteraceae bacterium]